MQKLRQTRGRRISELGEKYCAEKVAAGSWTSRSQNEVETSFRILEQLLGNKLVSELSYADLRKFKESLQKIPANYSKKPEFKGRALADIVKSKPDKPISITTVNKHLTNASSLLEWGRRHGYCAENYADT